MVSSEIDEAEKNPYEIYLAAGGIVLYRYTHATSFAPAG